MKGSKNMDNNYSHRPRKRISKETARKRQLTALCVIAFIVLMIIILIAKGCSKDSKKSSGSSNSNTNTVTTTTVSVTATVSTIATEAATVETTTVSSAQTGEFKMRKYTYALAVGETDTAWIDEYPDGTTEDDERWSSDNDKIATVDQYGHITGVAPGDCYITVRSASDPTKEAQIKVMVTD